MVQRARERLDRDLPHLQISLYDGYFDDAFRELLGQVYDAVGEQRPAFTKIPIVPQPFVEPDQALTELTTIEVDNEVATPDWANGGRYEFDEGDLLGSLDYVFDKESLFIRAGFTAEVLGQDNVSFDLYLGFPGASERYGQIRGWAVLGFEGTHRLTWNGRDPVTLEGPEIHTSREMTPVTSTPAVWILPPATRLK